MEVKSAPWVLAFIFTTHSLVSNKQEHNHHPRTTNEAVLPARELGFYDNISIPGFSCGQKKDLQNLDVKISC